MRRLEYQAASWENKVKNLWFKRLEIFKSPTSMSSVCNTAVFSMEIAALLLKESLAGCAEELKDRLTYSRNCIL